jgi:hypothetical protein
MLLKLPEDVQLFELRIHTLKGETWVPNLIQTYII